MFGDREQRKVILPELTEFSSLFPTWSREESGKPYDMPDDRWRGDVKGWACPRRGFPAIGTDRHMNQSGLMVLGTFCSVKGVGLKEGPLWVGCYRSVAEAVFEATIAVDGDRMFWEIIGWEDGRALVLAQHSVILGNVWAAFIDAKTVPEPMTYREMMEAQQKRVKPKVT